MLGRRSGAAGGLFALQCPHTGFFLFNGPDTLLAEPGKASEEIGSTGSTVGSAVVAVEHATEVEQELRELQVVALAVELNGQVFDITGLHLIVAAKALNNQYNHWNQEGYGGVLAEGLGHGYQRWSGAKIAAVDEALLGESQQVIGAVVAQQRVFRGVALQQLLTFIALRTGLLTFITLRTGLLTFGTLRTELRTRRAAAGDQLVGALRE